MRKSHGDMARSGASKSAVEIEKRLAGLWRNCEFKAANCRCHMRIDKPNLWYFCVHHYRLKHTEEPIDSIYNCDGSKYVDPS